MINTIDKRPAPSLDSWIDELLNAILRALGSLLSIWFRLLTSAGLI